MHKRAFSRLTVRRKPGYVSRGWLIAGPFLLPVALGWSGIKANKREGDGGTPRGRFQPKRLWWRADRHSRPATLLPTRRIKPDDSWCENPKSGRYNRPIKGCLHSNADKLSRADALYDFIVEIDHNTRPRVAGRGSAVFIHIARDGFAPTAGCIALNGQSLKRMLSRMGLKTQIIIE
jgi:L,D-peptidoglycan transpeptidase YkuD (ErfK/YbiS/YcfS/YnhG family)